MGYEIHRFDCWRTWLCEGLNSANLLSIREDEACIKTGLSLAIQVSILC